MAFLELRDDHNNAHSILLVVQVAYYLLKPEETFHNTAGSQDTDFISSSFLGSVGSEALAKSHREKQVSFEGASFRPRTFQPMSASVFTLTWCLMFPSGEWGTLWPSPATTDFSAGTAETFGVCLG